MLKTRKVLQSYDPAGLDQVWTVFLTTTKKLTNEFISANLFGILFFLSIAMLSLMTVSVPFSCLKFYFLQQKCGFFLWFPCTEEFSRKTIYQKIFSEFFFVTIARLSLMTVYYFIVVFFKFNSCITEM